MSNKYATLLCSKLENCCAINTYQIMFILFLKQF